MIKLKKSSRLLILMSLICLFSASKLVAQDYAGPDKNICPGETAQIGNAFNNQFQMPLLFFVLVIFTLMTGKQDYLFIICEWLFVLLRLGHAYVHVTSNNVPRRFQLYVAGTLLLMLMWIWYAIRVMAADRIFTPALRVFLRARISAKFFFIWKRVI